MTDETAQFLPFHALNEFMRHDYRQTVIRTALNTLPNLPAHFRQPIDKLTNQIVRVPGFRKGSQAPASLKVVPISEAFGKSPELVAAILAAWAESLPDLRQQVHDLLKGRGWEVLPPEADRAKLPGFLTSWPKGEDFDVLNKAFAEAHPDSGLSTDDVSLMVVWVSGRLPYQAEEEETDVTETTDVKDE